MTNPYGSFRHAVDLAARISVGANSAGALLGFAKSTAQAGQRWIAGQPYVGALILGRHTFTTSGFNGLGGHTGDFYELFAFIKSSNATEDYGWIHLNETAESHNGTGCTHSRHCL